LSHDINQLFTHIASPLASNPIEIGPTFAIELSKEFSFPEGICRKPVQLATTLAAEALQG